jgi:Leucine-rich repeat (LRR) protein
MKENLKLYRILAGVFLIIGLALAAMNINILKSSYLIKTTSVSSNNIIKPIVKAFGYSDILNILKEDENLEILGINKIIDGKNLIEADLKYLGQIEGLYNTLENIKREACFVSIEKIKINETENHTKDVMLTVTFLKDK